ncbi:hypothetical protein HanXRQr2_Chr02g0076551 [Helianthus annuus]|uniref:Uncharacterized protein n=1 Tax=Helianthus annuus TaxID=4232 RepID=A0A9K3JPH5_HELAN|nr:hypothetical protein HanXRQr2_Chr02g0076551 [Helianthus annuus]
MSSNFPYETFDFKRRPRRPANITSCSIGTLLVAHFLHDGVVKTVTIIKICMYPYNN